MTNPTIDPISYNAGIEAAKKAVAKRRDDYVAEHGNYDPSTGVTEFPGNGDEYVGELDEIAELIGSLHLPSPQTAPDEICILCANGNDLPGGETCPGCKRAGHAVGLAAAVIKARGRNEPPSAPVKFAAAPADAERLALADHLTPAWCGAMVAALAARSNGYPRNGITQHDVDVGRKLADAMPSILTLLRAGGWREDMENAPRDGTRILSWWDGQHIITYWAERIGFKGWQAPAMMTVRAHDKSAWQPTHWMPLPSAPHTDKND